jgi:hypothetical protein
MLLSDSVTDQSCCMMMINAVVRLFHCCCRMIVNGAVGVDVFAHL